MGLQSYWRNANTSLKLILIILVIALAYSIYHSFTTESKLDEWRDRYAEFQDSVSVILDRSDSLENLAIISLTEADSFRYLAQQSELDAQHLKLRIQKLLIELAPLSDANDSTFMDLTQERPMDEVIEREHPRSAPWIRLSFELKSETILLYDANALLSAEVFELEESMTLAKAESLSLRSSLARQTQRADELYTQLMAVPDAPPTEKLLGFIPLPSRKSSFLFGAIAGVTTTVVIATVVQN